MNNRLFTALLLGFFLINFSFAQEDLLVTEIQFDVPSSAAGDANGDGARSSRWDEFVELYNNGTESIDLSGYQLIEREGVAFFTFPLNATINLDSLQLFLEAVMLIRLQIFPQVL